MLEEDLSTFEDVFGLPEETTLADIMNKARQLESQAAEPRSQSKVAKLLAEFLSDPDVRAHCELKSKK